MPPRSRVDRPTPLNTVLPESLRAQLDLHLFSPLEGRVPKGAYQTFFSERIREFFAADRLDLAPFGFAGEVSGEKPVIEALKRRLTDG